MYVMGKLLKLLLGLVLLVSLQVVLFRPPKQHLEAGQIRRLLMGIEEQSAGYGNRVYTLLSAMTIALLTDRKLHIEWDQSWSFFQEPFEHSFQKPQLQSWESVKQILPSEKNAFKLEKDILSIMQTRVEYSEQNVKFDKNMAYFFEVCSNPVYFEKLLDLGVVRPRTVQNARELIQSDKNPNNSQLLEPLFLIGYEVGGYLLNHFWIPKKPILKQIVSFRANHFNGHYVIGLQLRMQFLGQNLQGFIKCAEKLELSTDKPIKWYISSDEASVIEQLRKKYPEKVIHGEGTIEHVGYGRNKKDTGFARVVMDIELLARTDALIVTSGSSFGLVASMKSDRLNYHVSSGQTDCQKMAMSNLGTARGFYVV